MLVPQPLQFAAQQLLDCLADDWWDPRLYTEGGKEQIRTEQNVFLVMKGLEDTWKKRGK